MDALATLPSEELYIQHGPTDPPACAGAFRYLPFAAIMHQIELAEVVVTHAGAGTILAAVQAGHTPVVFPRLRRYAEAVDDHQAELAEALADTGRALVAQTGAELAAAVAAVPPRRLVTTSRSDRLADAVRAAVAGPLELIAS